MGPRAMEWKKEKYRVTDSLSEFDMEFVAASLQSVWRRGSTRQAIETAFANSLCLGLFDKDRQIGFARAVTDRVFVSWICDVYVEPEYRKQGLGKWLMECISIHDDLVHTRLVLSSVPEAREFYESLGYRPMEGGYAIPPRGAREES